MKAIKKPLIYFIIWATCTVVFLGLGHGHIASTITYLIVSVFINFISHYHIVLPSDKAIKEKEPELYAELENKQRQIPFHGPELNAAAYLLFSGRAKNYPSIRPQIIEYIVYTVFCSVSIITVISVLVFLTR